MAFGHGESSFCCFGGFFGAYEVYLSAFLEKMLIDSCHASRGTTDEEAEVEFIV